MDQEECWDQHVPITSHQLPFLCPKELHKVVTLLKQQDLSTVKMKFRFEQQHDKSIFLELLKQEQNDQYFRSEGKKRDSFYVDMLKKKRKGFNENAFIFQLKDRLKTQVFFNTYRGNKLDQLQKSYNIKLYQLGPDIYIEGGQNKIKKGSIVYSQLLEMHKRLKIYVFYNDQKLWNIVQNSEDFKKRLQKMGIKSHSKVSKNKHVAFYSCELQPQQIRKQVLKQSSFQPRILKLADEQLSFQDNVRIFDILVKSTRATIEEIRDVYESNLEINKNNSCFVLHIKHEVFAEEPIALISKVVSDLFILSFPLRNYRTFINGLRRNANKYPFINATHYNKNIFCCIDRAKVKRKSDILAIFSPFLDELSSKSKLTIHMKPKCILQQKTTIPSQILDLIEESKLEVEDYSKIMDFQKFNIVITPKMFNSQAKKSQKQLEFGNFLIKLLLIKEKVEVTEDELNQSILNNSLAGEDITDDSGTTKNRRGNRKKQNQRILDQINTSVLQPKQKPREARSGRTGRAKLQQKIEKAQQVIKDNSSISEDVETKVKQSTSIKKETKKQNNFEQNKVQYQFLVPKISDQQELMKKQKKPDRILQKLIEQVYQVSTKCHKIQISGNLFDVDEKTISQIDKSNGYFVKNIQSDGKVCQKIEFVNLNSLQVQEFAFLVYMNEDQSKWVPTHIIQRF